MSRSLGGGRREEGVEGPGGRLHHRKERHYGCKERGPLVLLLVSLELNAPIELISHLLKLVTGVEISTRPVKRSGRPGKEVTRRSRTAAAAPNRAAFLLSIVMLIASTSERMKLDCFLMKSVCP